MSAPPRCESPFLARTRDAYIPAVAYVDLITLNTNNTSSLCLHPSNRPPFSPRPSLTPLRCPIASLTIDFLINLGMDMTTSNNSASAFHTSSSFSSLSSASSTTMPSLETTLARTPSSISAASAPLPSPTFQTHALASFPSAPASAAQTSHMQQPHQQQPQSYTHHQYLAPQQYLSQQQVQSQQLQQQQQQQPAVQRNPYQGQRGGQDGGAPTTSPFLQDFTLVAEAAKRAQMACLMRDMEGCEL
ncbi:hypothetical protein EV356DRAFT_564300 [Viridothelium virens]|uniref:Uncharacterized protein n=1 Tax=Viridothelium virens TaxID=1048519 RepID=A0A6A6HJW5_VIRVR|nr:hypothetical protein EV356DRAFT_564300 [Viridothelium virens]